MLDRCVDSLRTRSAGDSRGLAHVVADRVRAAAEAATRVQLVDRHLLRLEADFLRDDDLVAGMPLLAVPDLAAIRMQPHDAIQRLHRRVRQIRLLVGRVDELAAGRRFARHVAARHRDHARLVECGPVLLRDVGGTERQRVRIVPRDLQCIAPLARHPRIARQHRDTALHVVVARHLDDRDHAGNRLRLARVDVTDLAPHARRMGNHRDQHAGQLHVLRIDRRTVDLRGNIDTPRVAFADQLEVGPLLDGHLRRHRLARRIGGELAEARAAARCGVNDRAVLDAQRRRIDLPPPCGCRQQHRARGGGRLAHHRPRAGHRGTAARRLDLPAHLREHRVHVARRIGLCRHDAHLVETDVEFVRRERRDAGERALPHFEVLGHDADDAVGADANEGVRLERHACGCRRDRFGERDFAAETDRERERGHVAEKPAARSRCDAVCGFRRAGRLPGTCGLAHALRFSAALWIATRIR
ncbi:hypothetical protein BLA15945_05715 [Burkholderia lata]|uniref:Uncharacterized protein n=1 Tax=Burkholderia lata (strain ATCC 17760 / DSM 23089 / LMG 22485 / NCIMB 9086 / R18194 / 383) TaxID=482957 RepID=A0A6P2QBS8_BURL3|nr:hypothetical protein BLA15945_05715 [Burkholderia lata]